ncbi:MAG: copper oxidase [Acidobacteriota bacterium]|nr:copper oxidase [Acidobacteriota bacterium]
MPRMRAARFSAFVLLSFIALTNSFAQAAPRSEAAKPRCESIVRADVIAFDWAYQINRLGTTRTNGELYALRDDVMSSDPANRELRPGKIMLRPDKRPRPIVLRVNAGSCLEIKFANLLTPQPTDPTQPVTKTASIHVSGMQLIDSIADDGTWVGQNPLLGKGRMSGIVAPYVSTTYRLYAQEEGTNLLYSTAAQYNNFNPMQISTGLFGTVNVEPRTSEWYRSQVTEEELRMATIGTLPDGHPKINYDAVYPPGNRRAGKPILRMIDREGNTIHTDLTAIITGPNHGLLPGGPGDNPLLPERNLPFREVTINYHESQDVVQAFPYFMYANHSQVPRNDAGADTFGINFGIAGIAPIILANRIGVGPALDCPECKFEEFFLSSWAVGDPSVVVDVPANAPCKTAELLDLTVKLEANPQTFNPVDPCKPDSGKKATKAFFPDDPSNVYHSYLGDHVRFRVLHGGAAVHHIHHHHAHQWLRSPESSQSNYLDAQAVGPGSSFTAELVFAGSGNRNLTTGDSIFHCHFYPHFASGMWALYRVHDVFEAGTELDADGRPKEGARALPDGEIALGTPIPAVVPMPMMAMAPMPAKVKIVDGQAQVIGEGHPGYPFFIPGVAGHRAPHPPMDFAVDPKTNERLDGGLPRHLVADATIANEQHTTLDWSKDLHTMDAYELPEDGTPGEKRAIQFFSVPAHASFTPEGKPGKFRVNGLPRGPQPGAPFSDPAVVDGNAVGNPKKVYRGVDLQLNAVFNKAGWHYPQQRILALWGDVKDYVDGLKPPEPLFVRATNDDVIEYWHTNLVPAYFELDDFEVRTPTDILGQHIHLVKFDVLTSDGAANGFNYEDGTFSPEEVQERIHSINLTGGLWDESRKSQRKLTAKAIKELGDGPSNGSKAWVGAQATVQRWWLDPLMDVQPNRKVTEKDRTYMTVFTHDHFGPSTHQMIGLYGGVLIEPPNTKWTSLDGKTVFGTRYDGGPTSYAANIIFNAPELRGQSYREFALEWGDTQHGYTQFSRNKPDCYRYTRPDGTVYEQKPPDFDCIPLADGRQYYGWADPAHVLNCINCPPQPSIGPPPQALIPNLPGSAPWPPQPLLVTDFSVGMMSMNYRLEPLPARVFNPGATGLSNPNAAPDAADLSSAFRSIQRLDPAYSTQPAGGAQINPMCFGSDCFTFPKTPISDGMGATDPYTPMLHGYEGDKVQVRLLAGAHTSMHDYTMHGVRWLAEPFEKNSGYRNTQFILLSEHYELLFDLPRIGADPSIDYLYNPSASYEGLTNGAWGLMRVWNPSKRQPFLAPLDASRKPAPPETIKPPATMTTDCSNGKPCIREYEVHAMTVQQATGDPNASILYNKRGVNLLKGASDTANPLEDPLGLVYVVAPKGEAPKRTKTVEPMVLRANAGDWIHVTLVNDFTGNEPVFKTFEAASRFGLTYASPYNYIQIASSPVVGLHAQLVSYDIRSSDGATIGNNPIQTAAPGKSVEYWWYAGIIEGGKQTPVEFGAINLLPSDPLMQVYRGLFGSLIVEPAGSRWIEDPHSSSSATVWAGDKVFREFVVTYQNDANMLTNGASWWSTGSPLAGFNYRSEPPWLRFGKMLDGPLGSNKPADWTNLTQTDVNHIAALPMTAVNGTATTANQLVRAEPETPIFRAPARMPARFRLVMPGGDGDNQITWELTGHLWQEEPYTHNSTKIGYNPKSNTNGSLTGYGVTSAFEVVLDDTPGTTPSGGRFGVPGDYMYRAWTANMFQGGAWGVFRVAPWMPSNRQRFPDTVGITSVAGGTVQGYTTPCPVSVNGVCNAGGHVSSVSVAGQSTPVVDGLWTIATGALGDTFTVTSPAGGVATWGIVASSAEIEAAAIEQPALAPQQTGSRKTRSSRP